MRTFADETRLRFGHDTREISASSVISRVLAFAIPVTRECSSQPVAHEAILDGLSAMGKLDRPFLNFRLARHPFNEIWMQFG